MDDEFPLVDGIIHEILMHRDIHFSGSFEAMITYYEIDGKGSQPDFSLNRLEELARIEQELGHSLSDDILFEEEKKEVQHAREKYRQLQELYATDNLNVAARLVADLILAEDEDPTDEIAAVVGLGAVAVPALIDIITSEKFYQPLFPGYGEAPALAARCLGLIGDERAIRPLFEALGREDFFMEEAFYSALSTTGDSAKEFLLNCLKQMPLSKDNEQAAIALLHFKHDPTISKTCLDILERGVLYTPSSLAAYLIMGCHDLDDPKDRARLMALSQRADLPHSLKLEMDTLINSWDN